MLVARCLLFVACWLLFFVVRRLLFALGGDDWCVGVCCPLFVVCCLLISFAVCCPLVAVVCLLFVVCCVVFVVCCVLLLVVRG